MNKQQLSDMLDRMHAALAQPAAPGPWEDHPMQGWMNSMRQPAAPAGWKLVPIKPTAVMVDAGGHANSERLNDSAPIGESRYGGRWWKAFTPPCSPPHRKPEMADIDLSPDTVLEAASGKLSGVVVLGYDHEGEEYFAASFGAHRKTLWLIARLQHLLAATEFNPDRP